LRRSDPINDLRDLIRNLIANIFYSLTKTLWREKPIIDVINFFGCDSSICLEFFIHRFVERMIESSRIGVPEFIIPRVCRHFVATDLFDRGVAVSDRTLEIVFLRHWYRNPHIGGSFQGNTGNHLEVQYTLGLKVPLTPWTVLRRSDAG